MRKNVGSIIFFVLLSFSACVTSLDHSSLDYISMDDIRLSPPDPVLPEFRCSDPAASEFKCPELAVPEPKVPELPEISELPEPKFPELPVSESSEGL